MAVDTRILLRGDVNADREIGRVVRTVVFADGPRGGSACPVALDASCASAGAMRRAASDWGVESAFVVRGPIDGTALGLRFFAPLREMEMCVHGTIAALTALEIVGQRLDERVTVQTPAGRFTARRQPDGWGVEQPAPMVSPVSVPVRHVAGVVGAEASHVSRDFGAPCVATSSRPKLLLPLSGVEVLRRCEPRAAAIAAVCDTSEATGIYAFAERDDGSFEARHFSARTGYVEDPATGVAAAALGGYLLTVGAGSPERRIVVRQGISLGRPCRMDVVATGRSGPGEVILVHGTATVADDDG